MSHLTFFQQARADGGMRTGVECDGALLLHRFDAGAADDDPGLTWFIDVSFAGPRLPNESEPAREFLLARETETAAALNQLSGEISTTGIDAGAWPLRRKASASPDGISIALTCSAIRRVDGREIAVKLGDLARDWASIIIGLPAETELAR